MRLDESVVRAEGLLQDVALPAKIPLLFAARDLRPHPHRRVKRRNPRAERAHALAQNPLRHKFQLDLASIELFLKILRARPRKRGHHAANLPVLEKDAELAVARAAIVADYAQIARALPRKRLNQIIGKSRAAEPAEHDACALRNVGHGSIRRRTNLVFAHGWIVNLK